MGQAIAQSVAVADDLKLAGVWERGDDLGEIAATADVLIDFSLPEATAVVTAAAIEHNTPLVCGVSGLGDAQQAMIDQAAAKVAVVCDRNMSAGVAVLESLARIAAASLGPEFDVEVHETHHIHKIDAPSGTALKLGEAIAAARSTDADDIHYEVERRGEIPGDHTVILRSPTECLTLGHSVTTRQVFAAGALRAARWLQGQPPGRYLMRDVLT